MSYNSLNLVVAEQVRRFRLAKARSVRGIGRASKVAHGHLRYIEMGCVSPSINILARVSKTLDVRPADLINTGTTDAEAVYELLRNRPDLVASLLHKLRSTTPLQIQNA